MEHNAQFEGEVLTLLRRLSAKKEQLQAQYTKELAELDKQIEAVQMTARLMRETSEGIGQLPLSNVVIPPNLRGKSVREACVEIARHNHGQIKISDATPVLLNSGVIRWKKHAWGATYTACARSKDFEKDPNTRGAFRLVGSEVSTQSNLLQ